MYEYEVDILFCFFMVWFVWWLQQKEIDKLKELLRKKDNEINLYLSELSYIPVEQIKNRDTAEIIYIRLNEKIKKDDKGITK